MRGPAAGHDSRNERGGLRLHRTVFGLATLLLTASAGADAQSLDLASLHEVDRGTVAKTAMGYEGRSVMQIERTTVVRDGWTVGRIQEVLADAENRIVAVIVEHGGFLGIGERRTVVPIEALRFGKDQAALTLSEDELDALPTWKK